MSKTIKSLVETHKSSMLKHPTFESWAKSLLRGVEDSSPYERAYNQVHKIKAPEPKEPESQLEMAVEAE